MCLSKKGLTGLIYRGRCRRSAKVYALSVELFMAWQSESQKKSAFTIGMLLATPSLWRLVHEIKKASDWQNILMPLAKQYDVRWIFGLSQEL